jgi:hypothetical protein
MILPIRPLADQFTGLSSPLSSGPDLARATTTIAARRSLSP